MNDLTLILVVGICFYLLDIFTHSQRYEACWNLPSQASLLLHHIYFIFAFFGFLASDKRVLTMYILLVIISLLHWQQNGDHCAWTQQLNEDCQTTGGLRTIFSYFSVGGHSSKVPSKTFRKYQKLWYIMGALIALSKLNNTS